MKKIQTTFFMLILLWALSAASLEAVEKGKPADAGKKGTPAVQTPPAPKKTNNAFDIMLLIDSSGSMRKTDPGDYRKAAAKLFISLMSAGDRAGIVSFGDSAKVLAPLTQTTGANHGKLVGAINKVSSKEYSTHIQDGVKKGLEELGPPGGRTQALLLMSDGKLTLGSKEKEEAAYAELNKTLPGMAKSGIKLYSVAFTEMSDEKLLEDMAKATGGFFKFAKSDKDIHTMFMSIFEKIKAPDEVPLEGNTFTVDKDIHEVILVISKAAGTSTVVVDPASKKFTSTRYAKNMQWFGAKVFDMITIKEPAVGKWKVNLSTQEGNKVFVITNLRLKSSFDKSFVNKGEKFRIDAWLEKEGGLLQEKDVLDQVTFYAEITGPDKKTEKLALQGSGDGRYSAEFTAAGAGEYSGRIVAESKTFKREKTVQFKATEPPAGQKSAPAAAVRKGQARKGVPWETVLIRFGIINAALLGIAVVVYSTRKISAKRKTKVKKRK